MALADKKNSSSLLQLGPSGAGSTQVYGSVSHVPGVHEHQDEKTLQKHQAVVHIGDRKVPRMCSAR